MAETIKGRVKQNGSPTKSRFDSRPIILLAAPLLPLATAYQIPGYTLTTSDQFRVFRMLFLQFAPSLLSSPHVPRGQVVTAELSPAGGIYLALHLIQQKLLNAEYQVPADQWIKRFTAASPTAATISQNPGYAVAADSQKISADKLVLFQRLSTDSANESGGVIAALHKAFDQIGIDR